MKVEFLTDYGNNKKGTCINVDSQLASALIKKEVAKIFVEKEVKPKKEK